MYRVSPMLRMESDVYVRNRTAILKKRKAAVATFAEFQTFLRLNNLGGPAPYDYDGDMLLRYSSCLEFARMDKGSILTKLRYIEGETRRARMPSGISCRMVHSLFAEAKAKAGAKHALDASQKELVTALSLAPSSTERTQLSLMLITGVRNKDIEGFGDLRFIKVENSWEIYADVTIAKQRKSPEDKTLLQLRGPTSLFGSLSSSMQRDLVAWDKKNFKEVGLVLLWMKGQHGLCKYTTYTFRRCFIHIIIHAFTRRRLGLGDSIHSTFQREECQERLCQESQGASSYEQRNRRGCVEWG